MSNLKTALGTAAKTPWIVGLALALLGAILLVWVIRGDLTLELALAALGVSGVVGGGVAYSERKAKREA